MFRSLRSDTICTDCEGFSRRDFLKVGSLGFLGLTLPDVLRLQADQGASSRKDNSCIFIWLAGGPSHIDMWDPKPEAPPEIRGSFASVSTNITGIQISEHLSRSAQVMDRFAILRSVTSPEGSHERASRYLQTGYRPLQSIEFPSYGSVTAREKGQKGTLPPYVVMLQPREQGAFAGYIGAQYNPFFAGNPGLPRYRVQDLVPPPGVELSRIERRKALLGMYDDAFRKLDMGDKVASMDAFLETAYRMMFSPQAREAFDIGQEPDSVRDRYGRTDVGQATLLARRLVEAGTRFVSIYKGGWDTHGNNFTILKQRNLPEVDTALSALLEGLHQRGLLDTTLVVMMGEFGRTPKINPGNGRDHWPHVMSVVMAGAGVQGGRAIGESDASAAYPKERPVRVEDVAATIYHSLGVDFNREYRTPQGRPIKIVSEGEIVHELFA